eukprot:3118245-Lingulodinium_polyedra.AAC.1
MGCPFRAGARMCLKLQVTKAIVNTTGWLAIRSTYLIGAPMMGCPLHGRITSFHNVANVRFSPN